MGEILVTFEGDILWVSSAFHIQYVTSLIWIAKNSLLSASLDGRIVLSKLNSNGTLDILKDLYVSSTDLPRALRKSTIKNYKNAGIVSISINSNDEIYVAGNV